MAEMPKQPEGQSQPATASYDASNLLVIVVGAHLRAEVADRPIAYRLVEEVRRWQANQGERLTVRLSPVVCSDVWYMNQEPLQRRPTISVGGPGVNALSAYYAQKLNPALVRENQMIIQLDPEFVDLRVCVWGMNHEMTVGAVNYFAQHYLDSYLRAVATQVEPQVD